MVMSEICVEIEKMSDHFVKCHLNGLPFDAVIHHFTSIAGENAHCHPFSFTTHILSGGYVERVYTVEEDGRWSSELLHRKTGTTHRVESTHIHEIVELPAGDCYTLILPEEKVKESKFWKFDENGSHSRFWYEGDFAIYEEKKPEE